MGYSLAHENVGYAQESLESMTIAEIKSLANDLGYTITSTKKADIIAEFMAQQEA